MRIALISPRLDPTDGYGNITAEFCAALVKKPGITFTLFLPASERKYVERLKPNYPVRYDLARYAIAFNAITTLPYFRPINVRGYDIVHSLFDFPHCFQAAWSAMLFGKPFIMGVQGTYGITPLLRKPDRWCLKFAYRRAKAVTAPSTYTRDLITKMSGGKYPIHVIHNGVNLERFSKKVDASAITKKFHGKKMLLTVGGIKARKGQDLVIRALGQLYKKGKNNVEYIIVGEGPQHAEYKALAHQLGVADHVHFVGNKTDDHLLEYFDAADIYVHTPRVFYYNFEGFGIVYLEASARSKPIVAADAGGIRDAVIDGKTGIVVPEEDVSAITAAIEKLLNDPDLRLTMGKAGRAYAEQHDWSVIVDQFLPLYQSALL